MNNNTLKTNKTQLNLDLNDIISDKMNNDLRIRYAETLAAKFEIRREDHSESNEIKKKNNKLVLLLKACILLAVIFVSLAAIKNITPTQQEKTIETKELAKQILAENKFEYLGNSRSHNHIESKDHQNAFVAFEKKDYQETINMLQKITAKKSSENFFIGLSFLELDKYQNAITSFTQCLSKISNNDEFYHEAKLYLIISYILNDQFTLASQLFKDLKKDSWEQKQLQSIMSTLS